MTLSGEVHLQVELLTEDAAWQLAQFLKLVRFEQCRELTEAHLSPEQRDKQAYTMLYALEKVALALRVKGFAPR